MAAAYGLVVMQAAAYLKPGIDVLQAEWQRDLHIVEDTCGGNGSKEERRLRNGGNREPFPPSIHSLERSPIC